MPLPHHGGPFQVGAIDLEVPVRNPRAFAADIVSPDQINKPSKKARKRARAAQEKASDKEGTATPRNDNDDEQDNDDGDADSQSKLAQWSPFHHGAHTSTLYFSTVLFTIYYPSSIDHDTARKHYRKAAWLGRPKRKGAKALVDYLGQYGLGGPFAAVPASPALVTLISAKIPAYAGAPLADLEDPRARAPPPDNRIASGLFGGQPPRFPVVVFSHGLAGSRLAYSQLCGELASQGVIVAAIEHRDGSGISSTVRPPIDPSLSPIRHRPRHHKVSVPYFDFSAVGLRSFPTDPSEKEMGMRQAQLAMRSAEIDECMHVLQRIFDGEGDQVAKESTRTLTTKLCGRPRRTSPPSDSLAADPSLLKHWKGKLDMEYPALIGHSFGGATVMEHLRGKSPQFPYGIIFDPWVEPIIIEDSNPRPLRAPVYVVSSEAFTVWEEHHEKVKRLVKDAQLANSEHRGWLITVSGSEHLSFSDFPLLLPRIFRATMTPSACISMFSRMALVQMGLLRQRHRERAGKEGNKYGDPSQLKEEEGKDETLGVQAPGEGQRDPQWESFAQQERNRAQREAGAAVERGEDPIRGEGQHDSEDKDRRDHDEQQRQPEGVEKHDSSGSGGGGGEKDAMHGDGKTQAGPPGSESQKDTYDDTKTQAPTSSSSSTHTNDPNPPADPERYNRVLNEYTSPKNKTGEERKEAMSTLRDAKARTAETLRAHRRGEKDAEEREQEREQQEHSGSSNDHYTSTHHANSRSKTPPPRGVRAHRTPSGGMTAEPRTSKDMEDFTVDPAQLISNGRQVDDDVNIVLTSVQDISQSQQHKTFKLRSLMGLLYRSYGMKPGLERPGTVLVHDLGTGESGSG